MNNLVRRDGNFRRELFNEVALKKRVPPVIIEKDFWVCWVLGRLFEDDAISPTILFKGGTSLSKVFNVIERFSEDIDLIMDWRLFTDDNPRDERSRNQQEKFNRRIIDNAAEYLGITFLPQLRRLLSPAATVEIDGSDPHIINISYPSTFTDQYISSTIRLETGPLGAWSPNETYSIHSYVADYFPDLFEQARCEVKAIKAERTFWEKATILHQEAHRPEGKARLPRYSRHYYDIYRMADTDISGRALMDMELLREVVDFKKKFYSCAWARYELAAPGTFQLVPPDCSLEWLRRDYAMMRNMIFGEYPNFDVILECLRELENKINRM